MAGSSHPIWCNREKVRNKCALLEIDFNFVTVNPLSERNNFCTTVFYHSIGSIQKKDMFSKNSELGHLIGNFYRKSTVR